MQRVTDHDLAGSVARQLPQAAEDDAFPTEGVEGLRRLGLLHAPMPLALGGSGWATATGCSAPLAALLHALGARDAALGRVYEAHVNALRLACLFATPGQLAWLARRTARGTLFGLWVAPAADPARLIGATLAGEKGCCSAAGHAQGALVTAADEAGQERMLLLDLADANHAVLPDLAGLRASATRRVRFDTAVTEAALLGEPGDYTAEPEFSTGAWRTSAVLAGAVQGMVDEAVRQLVARGRHDDPHQGERIGRMLIAARSARLWVEQVVRMLDAPGADPADAAAWVGLARAAGENAAYDAIALVQRSLGLAAVMRGNRLERQARDLATYLRQPAGDAALLGAAGWFAANPAP